VTPERLREIERLFHAAREQPPAERHAWLARECADDSAMRREVESLLAQAPGGVLDAPVGALVADLVAPPRVLRSGRRIGGFEVQGLLGVGGMGEVYRARDTRLGRDVAIKILPRAFKDDPQRLARFEREARVLASLNHPHIGAIYGLEDADGATALVMELVEGDDLSQRIARGAIPIAEALPIARQIAEALEVAHEQGVIHRDLKPANIKVRTDGAVKVLDFGLAKALDPASSSSAEVMNSPTFTPPSTMIGTIIGTAAYMAPEQARGKAVDRRADIWAFGVVVYEMLTGRRPFDGDDTSTTLASVIKDDVSWQALPADLPAPAQRMLRRCLEKDPRRRLSAIGDARIELEDAMATPTVPAALPSRRGRNGLALSAVALGIAIALVFLWVERDRFGRPSAPSPADTRVTRLTDFPGLEESPAISPDGKSVAFTGGVGGKRQVFVQLIAGGAPLQITRDPVDHGYPRWSPDSSSIFYFSAAVSGNLQGSIWEIPALGGVPRRVVNSVGGADVGPADGRLAFFRLSKDSIQLVMAPRDASKFDVVAEFPPATYYLYPRWSPDGRWIAFQRGDSVRFDVFVAPAAGGEPRRLTHDNNMMSGFAWLPDSTGIVYSSSRGGTIPYLSPLGLWQVTLRDGSVRRVTSGETSYVSPDISKSGAMLVGRMSLQTDIWKFPVDGLPTENVRHGVRVTRQTGQVLTPTASPSDKEVAFLSDSGGHANLWVVDTESGALRQITHERDPNVAVGVPVWSPDGHAIAFVSSRGNEGWTFGVWLVDPDGSNLRNIANPGLGPAWSPDGRWVYYSTRGDAAATDVVLKKVPVDGGPAVTVTTERLRNAIGVHGTTLYYSFERPLLDGTPEFEIRAANPENAPFRVLARIPASRVPIWQIVSPALSPDGKWLAQALTDGFTTNVWALSTTSGEWRQITDFGERTTFIARRVSWSSDGRSILAAVAEGDSDIVLLDGLINAARE
jgi:serine/threonine protein kinase/Tol biopolymer transport system component